ncbi:MAG: PAS domain S-box protein [Balneolales bacterium]
MVNFKNIRSIFKASPTPQLILFPDATEYTIAEVNEAYLQATHATEKQIMGKPLFEVFPGNPGHPDGEKSVRTLKTSLDQVLATKKAHKLPMQRYDIPKRGTEQFEEKYWIPYNYPVLSEQGEVDFIIHSPTDVTGQVLAEQHKEIALDELHREMELREKIQQQLSREKSFAESVINSLPGVFYLFDEKGRFFRWNQNLEDLTGYTAKEIGQMDPLMFVNGYEAESIQKTIHKIFSGTKARVEAHLRLKDGQTIPFLFSGMSLELDGQKYLIGTGLDLTEREKERAERMRMSEVLEKSRNEIYIFDEKTLKFIDVNAGARENLGFTLEELKKMTPLDIKPDFDKKSFLQLVSPLKEKRKDKIVFNTVHRRADGSLYDVEVHLQLIQQNGSEVFVAIILDITDRLEIEARVKSSLQEKEVLLNEIHHRVKNNLAIISSLLNMQAHKIGNHQLKQILIESQGRVRSMGMIHELLYEQKDFSRIDFGIYITKLLQHITANYHRPDRSIKTDINTDSVYLDINTAVPCALIINELITNAYKHAFEGRDQGRIAVQLSSAADSFTLVFSDNGVGLPQEPGGGSLGLSLIHGLAKQIGADVTITREQGTTFTLTFPAAQESLKTEPALQGNAHTHF